MILLRSTLPELSKEEGLAHITLTLKRTIEPAFSGTHHLRINFFSRNPTHPLDK